MYQQTGIFRSNPNKDTDARLVHTKASRGKMYLPSILFAVEMSMYI